MMPLAEPAERHVKQLGLVAGRTGHQLSGAGDNVEREHMVDLGAAAKAGLAHAADAERAAD